MKIPTFKLPVSTFEGASPVCEGYIKTYDLGGGNWIGGQVLDAITNKQVA